MNRILLLALLWLLPCLSLASEHAPKQVIIPFAFAKSGHLIIEVSFNGMQPRAMLIDTAAGISLLDRKAAREMGLPFSKPKKKIKLAGLGNQRQNMRDLQISDLEIGMAVFPAPEFYTTDLRHIRYIKASQPVAGILGTDFLVKHKGIVNYVDQTLTLTW